MDVKALVVVSAVLFGWGLLSARARRAGLTPPIVFVGVGGLLAWSGLVNGVEAVEELTPLVEVTLVWVLFSDAARLRLAQVRRDLGAYGRLLGVGLPLTILLGWGLAAWFFPDLGIWLALFIGAALAPTDAAHRGTARRPLRSTGGQEPGRALTDQARARLRASIRIARMRRVASNPSTSGIWQSISTRS